MRGGDRAGAKIIGRFSAAKGQFHVGVGIDAAGNYEFVFGVDRHVSLHIEPGANDRNSFAFDQDVSMVIVTGGDDLAVTD